MLQITLAQMRRSAGRLTAAGIAIVIGTAFVAATLLAGAVITRTVNDSIAARYADADLVIGATTDTPITDVGALEAIDGVTAAAPVNGTSLGLTVGNRTVYQLTIPTTDPRLMPLDVTDGAMPDGRDQVALPADVAERLDVAVGDTVAVTRDEMTDGGWQQITEQPVVVGLLDDPYGAYAQSQGAAVLDADTFLDWEAASWGTERGATEVSVALDPGADVAAVQAALAAEIGGTTSTDDARWVVETDVRASEVAASFTGDQDLMFLVFVLTFAAIALVVAGLVIANTFQVLVAQRTRTLALLRCVGADKAQVGRGVLTEAAILGAIASAAGVLLGVLLGQSALWIAHAMDVAVPLPDTIALTWQVIVIPMVVGVLVTVGAALVPARVATRVAPLAALRPADGPSVSRRAGRVRLVLSLLATVFGFALLAGGALLGTIAQEPTVGLLAGIAGGASSFIGVAVGAVFWLPKVTSLAGRLVGTSGPTARLAAANTLRNPRRTATTSTALLIGVTLVAMMSTGAASARASLTEALDEQYPVDVVVSSTFYDDAGVPTALPDELRAEVATAEGVSSVADLANVTLESPDFALDEDGAWVPADSADAVSPWTLDILAVDPAAARAVMNAPGDLAGLEAGTVVLGSWFADGLELSAGDTMALSGPGGTESFTVAVVDDPYASYLAWEDAAAAEPGLVANGMYVSLSDAADPNAAVGAIQFAVADADEPAQVTGAVVERAMFDQLIDTLLGIVVGLLAVAVVIALIGVANTLSLSVIERRKESATLRAIGLSKAQLRGMLAIEGLLIAGVGAVLGVALGLVYGWSGAAAALGVMGDVTLSVPWRDVALVLLVALVAGLVASVAPARTALKASPVEALAAD
ncbi:FtsX-like permease family protein [Isoptericola halotolerans]|uniref:ABC transport system permease protein n=1 Tax=Isoptericola halotolerans TaxID=300560 RepID=A0ABX2A475_9MICO|nr:FtsX-like permease family protein [Isoptericola halotolerans]NOV97530.1 putative ABC transport system permease protein [Isoptericola halotolerans]